LNKNLKYHKNVNTRNNVMKRHLKNKKSRNNRMPLMKEGRLFKMSIKLARKIASEFGIV